MEKNNVVSITGAPVQAEVPTRLFTDEHLVQMVEMAGYEEGRAILRRASASDADYVEHTRLCFQAWALHISYVLDQDYGIGEKLADRVATAKAVLERSAPITLREDLQKWLKDFHKRLDDAAAAYEFLEGVRDCVVTPTVPAAA